MKIGITGQTGFIGSRLAGKIKCRPDWTLIEFERSFFENPEALRRFAEQCDAVVHLAGLSRHSDGDFLYRTNVDLARKLAAVAGNTMIYLGSTTHIGKDLPYHRSKRRAAEILNSPRFGELRMPNTFGPFGKPFFNSVVSTFCAVAAKGDVPERIDSVSLDLIYVDDLCDEILRLISTHQTGILEIPSPIHISLPELWRTIRETERKLRAGDYHFSTRLEFQIAETLIAR